MRAAAERAAVPIGWRPALVDLAERIAEVHSQARISGTWFDEVGVLRIRATCPAAVRGEVNRLLRACESELMARCERCGEPGRVRSGVILTVRCDGCS